MSRKGVLSEVERAHLLQDLETSGRDFERAVEAVPVDRWQAGPENGSPWTPGQIAEHVTLTEIYLLKLVREKLLATPELDPTDDRADLDQKVPAAVLDPTRRPQAPERVRPTGRWVDGASLLEAFHKARSETIEYIRSTDDPLRAHRIARPGLGDMDGYHYMLLLTAHTKRHTQQLQAQEAHISEGGGPGGPDIGQLPPSGRSSD